MMGREDVTVADSEDDESFTSSDSDVGDRGVVIRGWCTRRVKCCLVQIAVCTLAAAFVIVPLDQAWKSKAMCKAGLNRTGAVARGEGERCFCLFTGGCLELWSCGNYSSMEQCQHASCEDRQSLEITSEAASFFNMRDHADVLTIPVPFYHDISALKHCRQQPEVFL